MELSRRSRLEKLKSDGELECPICMRKMFELHHDLTPHYAALQRDPTGPAPAALLDPEHADPQNPHAIPVKVAFKTSTGIMGVTSSRAADAPQRANASWSHSPTTLRLCHHTFCAACVDGWLAARARSNQPPICPTCRCALDPAHPRLRQQARRSRELDRYAAAYARAAAEGAPVPFADDVVRCGEDVFAALDGLARAGADMDGYVSTAFLELLQHWPAAVRGALAAARAMRRGGGDGGPVRMSASRVCDLIFFNMVDEDARRWARERGLPRLPEAKSELRRTGVHRERLEYHFAATESAEFGKFAQMAVGRAILRDQGYQEDQEDQEDQETGLWEGFHRTYGYGHGGVA
ncbi:hypothetical protein NpPPO83_00012380 [Neofusicoccum parvum]|uniref:Uncharacterized protein n=1 Tax=Neofusicoccum parvum TaxID=310453 RepID=A0ACB5RNJ7_9PEZI|nr:hypothetical protein NpPPO83_00012380 [Neofusicoccum parvum]